MEHLENLKTPDLPVDPLIQATRNVIAEREATVTQLRNDLAALEVEDTADFLDLESPRALERRALRVRLNAELHQATASLEGAKAFLARREAIFMVRSIRALRQEIDRDLQKAVRAAFNVNALNEEAAREMHKFMGLTTSVAQRLHGARGRNLLTKDGHVARASLLEIANPETHAFWFIRHISGLVGWTTQWGAGPGFAHSAGGAVNQANMTIATLLGDECFDPDVVAAVDAEDAGSAEVALVEQTGG
jgi:hypothetical protein